MTIEVGVFVLECIHINPILHFFFKHFHFLFVAYNRQTGYIVIMVTEDCTKSSLAIVDLFHDGPVYTCMQILAHLTSLDLGQGIGRGLLNTLCVGFLPQCNLPKDFPTLSHASTCSVREFTIVRFLIKKKYYRLF